MTAEIALPDQPTPIAQQGAPSALVEWAHAAVAAHELAGSLSRTQFCPDAFRDKPGEATAAILAGAEVGMSPLAALNAFDVIQGRPAPKAITLRALAQSHGHDIWLESATDRKVVMKGQRKGSSRVQESVWTLDRAKALNLTGKPNWKSQPQAMLTARATSEISRLVAADVILGIPHSAEELADLDPEPTRTVARGSGEKRTVSRKLQAAPEPASEPDLDDAPAPEPEPVTESDEPSVTQREDITKAQLAKMHATFNDLGVADRAERLRISSQITGLALTSANDLSKTDATVLIDVLEQIVAGDAILDEVAPPETP